MTHCIDCGKELPPRYRRCPECQAAHKKAYSKVYMEKYRAMFIEDIRAQQRRRSREKRRRDKADSKVEWVREKVKRSYSANNLQHLSPDQFTRSFDKIVSGRAVYTGVR